MHDLVIRGGTLIDGSGAPRFAGDIAIDGGRITQVDGRAGAAKRVIDAAGALVTPGWVDVHTHCDGQVTWDPYITPSSWHGVTTAVMGNCGVGFAPVRPHPNRQPVHPDAPGPALEDRALLDDAARESMTCRPTQVRTTSCGPPERAARRHRAPWHPRRVPWTLVETALVRDSWIKQSSL